MDTPLLSIKNLSVQFDKQNATAVDDISFDLKAGEKLGIVGESGSGKSVTCRTILQLLPQYAKVSGQINYAGENLLSFSNKEMYGIRGKEIAMIFQEPMTSLNPLFTIGNQLKETLLLHQSCSKREAEEKAIEALRLVRIPNPEQRIRQYPFELSGGMRQRVMIAMAMVCRPRLLIADEPTTALDVTIQAQILDLMNDLNSRFSSSLILITHDLGVIAETVDRVAVMYAGNMVEMADVHNIFHHPLHPYTKGLLRSILTVDHAGKALNSIPGTVPSLSEMPAGCRFCTRCAEKRDICGRSAPPTVDVKGTSVKCWMYTEKWDKEAT